MNKTESARYVEEVSGTIIGEVNETRRVALVAPNGRVQREANIFREIDPKAWAKAQKDELLHDYLVDASANKGVWCSACGGLSNSGGAVSATHFCKAGHAWGS